MRKIISAINENVWIQLLCNISGVFGFLQILNPTAFVRIFSKAFEQQKMSITIDIKTVTDILSIFFAVFIVTLLMALMKQLYEQRIMQQLMIVNTQVDSWIQTTSGWKMETELKARLTDGQIKYAIKKGWIDNRESGWLIWI